MTVTVGALAGRLFAGGGTRARWRAHRLLLALAGALVALFCVAASAAHAGIDQELAVFSDCPISTPEVSICAYSTVDGGEFKLGSKAVPINKTIVLQGGLRPGSDQLVPAADGNTLSRTALTVPGGLVGIEGLGGEVTATAELAGPVTLDTTALLQGGPSVILPLKVKLDHPVLGSSCYIGSNSEPVTVALTTGSTSPPGPNTPISGKTGTLSFAAAGTIVRVTGTVLVENAFAVPGVNGCGLVPLRVRSGRRRVGRPAGGSRQEHRDPGRYLRGGVPRKARAPGDPPGDRPLRESGQGHGRIRELELRRGRGRRRQLQLAGRPGFGRQVHEQRLESDARRSGRRQSLLQRNQRAQANTPAPNR